MRFVSATMPLELSPHPHPRKDGHSRVNGGEWQLHQHTLFCFIPPQSHSDIDLFSRSALARAVAPSGPKQLSTTTITTKIQTRESGITRMDIDCGTKTKYACNLTPHTVERKFLENSRWSNSCRQHSCAFSGNTLAWNFTIIIKKKQGCLNMTF